MEPKTQSKDADCREADLDIDEELAGVLTAISVVSKRLAKKLTALRQQTENAEEGGKADEQDE